MSKQQRKRARRKVPPLVRCSSCRWWHGGWDRVGKNEVGVCQRFPTQYVDGDGLDTESYNNPRT